MVFWLKLNKKSRLSSKDYSTGGNLSSNRKKRANNESQKQMLPKTARTNLFILVLLRASSSHRRNKHKNYLHTKVHFEPDQYHRPVKYTLT